MTSPRWSPSCWTISTSGGTCGRSSGESSSPTDLKLVPLCCTLMAQLLTTLCWQNVHVEVLYQRYFLRMNQNNMTSLLSLLIAIALTMIIVNYELSSADSIMQGVTLGVFSIMYLILVVLMTRSFLNEVYLIIFSYIVLASFFGIEVTDQLDPTSHLVTCVWPGVDSAGQRPAVCQRRRVVHHVLHLHDLHPAGAARRGVHRLRPAARLHSGDQPPHSSSSVSAVQIWQIL